jgi:hypothetical protein
MQAGWSSYASERSPGPELGPAWGAQQLPSKVLNFYCHGALKGVFQSFSDTHLPASLLQARVYPSRRHHQHLGPRAAGGGDVAAPQEAGAWRAAAAAGSGELQRGVAAAAAAEGP